MTDECIGHVICELRTCGFGPAKDGAIYCKDKRRITRIGISCINCLGDGTWVSLVNLERVPDE